MKKKLKISSASIGLFFAIFFLFNGKIAFAGNLIFRSGFESGSGPINTVLSDISGIDNSVSSPNNWDNLGFYINYHCGSSADRWAKIVPDPVNPKNKVLHFWLNRTEKCTADSRVQSIMQNGRPTERFQRVRMYLHPDMLKLLGSGTSWNWFMFQEFWIRPNWTGAPNSFRISFNLAREDMGTSGRFYWLIDANECCKGIVGQDGTSFWSAQNKTIPIPIGEWFTAETYYKMGDEKNGRMIFTIQKDGGAKQTIFDVTNWTYHPDEGPQGIYSWMPHKLYASPSNVDYVRNRGGTLQIYWDDWEVWDSMPSAASHYCGDKSCNNGETCSTCPKDCGACPCVPSWNCSAWSSCQNNTQARTCSDQNNCGISSGKPATSQSCISTKKSDFNQDGQTNIFDFNLFLQNFKKTGINVCDLNKDSKVDIFDFNIFAGEFGK